MFPGGTKIKIILTMVGDMPKNSAIPPQTPNKALFSDNLNLFSNVTPLPTILIQTILL